MNRIAAAFFTVAGVSALFRYAVEFADPAYYDPESLIDYGAVAGLTVAYVATGIALFFLWRNPPVSRGSLFLLFAGLGAAATGLGNLLEDSFKIESAVWAFFGGGLVMMVSLIGAGVAAWRSDSARRTSGLFLLAAVPGGLLGFGLAIMGVAWIGFAYWIVRHRDPISPDHKLGGVPIGPDAQASDVVPSTIRGTVRLVERGAFGFPWASLVDADGAVLATLGRYSALNIFLGRGQRIELADGRKWRLKGRVWQRYVCPVLLDEQRLKLATSAPGFKDYAITCRDEAFTMIPAEKRPGRPRRWELLSFNEPVASVGRNPYVAEIAEPVPLPAVLLAFCLAVIGVMGEKELVQQMGWTGPVGH